MAAGLGTWPRPLTAAIQAGRTRDLTEPADLVRENFAYLRGSRLEKVLKA